MEEAFALLSTLNGANVNFVESPNEPINAA